MNKPKLTDLKYIIYLIRGELVKISHNSPSPPHLVFGHYGPHYRFKRIFGLNEMYFNIKRMQSLSLA